MNLREDLIRIKQVMGLKESIELIPVITNRFVYHTSNPIFRDQIEDMGLITKGRSESWLSDTPIEGKAIFATNSDDETVWFDSTYDDDIYEIDTSKIDNIWYNDPNFRLYEDNKYIITFDDIPKEAVKLIYKGTGKSKDEAALNESLNPTLRRRLNFDKENILNNLKGDIMRKNLVLDKEENISQSIFGLVYELFREARLEESEFKNAENVNLLRQYLKDEYYETISQIYDKLFNGTDDQKIYCLIKHSERYGGPKSRGFVECQQGWHYFLSKCFMLPSVDWPKIKEKLNNNPPNTLLLLASPLQGHPYHYYFSIVKR